jgi:guanyl-specific ribonuclease Sa
LVPDYGQDFSSTGLDLGKYATGLDYATQVGTTVQDVSIAVIREASGTDAAISGVEAGIALKEGNYRGAALSGVGMLPFVPGTVGKLDDVGDAAKRVLDDASTTKECIPSPSETRFVTGVRVVDKLHNMVFEGVVDLKATLDRIKAGESFPHRRDGSIFENRITPGRKSSPLPVKPPGYYREFVHPTPGIQGPGVQRIVIGKDGEIYYSPDHYDTFVPVNPR